jgi:osmoprotectant transport system substrate-binding protein
MPTCSLPSIRRVLAGVTAFGALALAACGSSSPTSSSSAGNPPAGAASKGTVVVWSANFPEEELLGYIYAMALQRKGIKVAEKFNIGAREAYYPEIEKGAVMVIPEFSGALLATSVDPASTAATTVQVNEVLKAKLPSSLEILESSSAQDKDSVTVTAAFAKQHHLTSIAQLKRSPGR